MLGLLFVPELAPILLEDGDLIRIVSEAGPGIVKGVQHDEVSILGLQLIQGILPSGLGLKGKACQDLSFFLLLSQGAEDILCLRQLQHEGIVIFRFLDLFL